MSDSDETGPPINGKPLFGFHTIMAGLLRDPVTLFACVFLVLLAIVAAFASWLIPHDPMGQNLALRNRPPMTPSASGIPYILGTDALGRDLLSRLMMGAQISVSIGVLGAVVSGSFGVMIGLIAGYYRGCADDLIMRFVDVMLGFPTLLVALFVLFVVGGGYVNMVLVLALTRWMIYARVTRGMTLALREEPFVDGARAVGASNFRIITRHILPNLLTPVMVLATLEVARLILAESALSFLGFGIQPPASSWGLEVASGRSYISRISPRAFRHGPSERFQQHIVKPITNGATMWKTCSPNSKIGGALPCGTTAVHIRSVR